MPEVRADAETGGDLRRFRTDLCGWLDDHDDSLRRPGEGASLAEEVAATQHNQRVLWDAGWGRYGWPELVGGLGGSPLLRTSVAEEAAERGLLDDSMFGIIEVLLPTMIDAAPVLAAEHAEAFLAGSAWWCQGFSEPEAGSDLASLRCRAVEDGDSWVVTGQKVWTTGAHFASKMVLLARTGTTESRHRGITALLVDMDTPGITVRPLPTINEQEEFAETFFDEVRVPKARVIGAVDGGWAVAMSMLRSERGGIFWMWSVGLFRALEQLASGGAFGAGDDARLGHAFLSLAGLRARSWMTQHRMAADAIPTPETSVDKLLMAEADQEIFDLAPSALGGVLEIGDTDVARSWRAAYMYSRVASVYGGTSEIQRNIVADQVLGLRSAG